MVGGKMPYSTESLVYYYSGLSDDLVQSVTGSDPTTMIENFIAKADQRIKKWIRIPILLHRELHLGDGENRSFKLGSEDSDMELYDYDPEGGVEKIHAVYMGRARLKLPYPKDCDVQCENNSSDYGSSNCTITDVANTVAEKNVGDYHIQGVFSAAGYMQYPSAQNLKKSIDHYDYVSFILETDDATVTFTLRLYDKDGNYNSYEFTLPSADIRTLVSIAIDNMTGSVDWDDVNLYYWELRADGACTVKLDGFNFNEGFAWGYPYGELYHTETETISTRDGDDGVLGSGYKIYTTYEYDPFKQSTPANIESASARLAGAFLWDYLAGYVIADSKLRVSGETLEPLPPRDVMMVMKKRLIDEARQDVAEYGFGRVGGVI